MFVYLAAKMKGVPEWNFPRIDEEKKRLEKMGHTVVSPADLVRCLGLKPESEDCPQKVLKCVVSINNHIISNFCDAVVLIRDQWKTSMGCSVEIALAQSLRVPILDSSNMEELEIPILPYLSEIKE